MMYEPQKEIQHFEKTADNMSAVFSLRELTGGEKRYTMEETS